MYRKMYESIVGLDKQAGLTYKCIISGEANPLINFILTLMGHSSEKKYINVMQGFSFPKLGNRDWRKLGNKWNFIFTKKWEGTLY